jgi:putative FmdB family regulatory protein
MPILEFHCNTCGSDFEEIVVTSMAVVSCDCGSRDLTQLMSVPAPARIQDFTINPDKGGRFRLDDATFHPSVKDPLPWDKGKDIKVYDMDFGKSERDRLSTKAQVDNL